MAIADISNPSGLGNGAIAGSLAYKPSYGPDGQDYRGLVWGSPIPLSAGIRALDGAVIWAGPTRRAEEVTVFDQFASMGIPNPAMNWNVRQSFAVAFGKKLDPSAPTPLVRRIWVNGALVYNNGEGVPIVFNAQTGEYRPAGSLTASGSWDSGGQHGTWTTGLQPMPPNTSSLVFRFYDGNEDQLPDPEIVAALGDSAPAYRGLMYMVISDIIVAQANLFKVPAPVFPNVRVELVDGVATGGDIHNFRMLDNATPVPFNDQVKLADWANRRLAFIAPRRDDQSSFLSVFDMDTASQLSEATISDGGTAVGTIDRFATWDYINDVFYTVHGSLVMLCSLGHDGVVIDNSLTGNGTPATPSDGTPNGANPATKFPSWRVGSIAYVLHNSDLKPILVGGPEGYVCAFGASNNGILPHQMTVEQYLAVDGTLHTVYPFPLHQRALDKHLSYQDVAFVVATTGTGAGVDVVFAKYSGGLPKINSVLRVYDKLFSDGELSAWVDGDGHIMIQESSASLPTKQYTRISVEYVESPDFGQAPGWQGVFPKVGAQLYSRAGDVLIQNLGPNALLNSDMSGGDICGVDGHVLHFNDGSTTDVSFSVANGGEVVWDSAAKVLYFAGGIDGTDELPLQEFSGRGIRFAQVTTGISGEITDMGSVLGALTGAAGYSPGDVSIDADIDDPVVGVIVNKPYSLSTLFNDLGAVYEFSYFNSAGALKFERTSNSPRVASSVWEISAAVADGATATIGSVVYRFKTAPSQAFDVKIETDTNAAVSDNREKTAKNFLAAIMGDISLASSEDGFFAGTTAHPKVYAQSRPADETVFGPLKLDVIARSGGAAGNSIATTDTSTAMAFTSTTLTGGVEPPDPVVSLTLDDLAHVSENQLTEDDALITTIVPEGQSQQAAQVNYYALEQSYQMLSQTFIPDNQNGEVVDSSNTVIYDLPIVMSTSEAYARATKTSIRQADNVVLQNFRLPQSYLQLEPTDVITITIPPYAYTIKLDECTFNSDFSTSFSAANYLSRSDVPVTGSDVGSSLPQDTATGSDGIPVVIDAPLRNPNVGTDAGVLTLDDGIRAYRTGFSAGMLAYTTDNGDQVNVFSTSTDVKWGTVLGGALPAAVEPYYRTVEDSIDVVSKTIGVSDVASGTYLDCVEGRNCLAVGSPGNWEFIYFRDVEWIADKQVRFTGLVRAQRGTDYAVAGHGPNDVVLLLDSVATNFVSATRTQPVSTDLVDEVFHYQAIGVPSSRTPVAQDNTIRGYTLWPFSPCSLAAAPGTSSSLDLSWVRRDRLNTEYVTNPTAMSEATEEYDLEILDGSTVVRTVNGLTSPAYNYSSADQTTDGFTPPMASIKFRVYQKGELGRGFPREETVDVN